MSSSFTAFSQLPIPKPLVNALSKIGFESPTPIQSATIPAGLKDRDILGCAQTGTGKTGAFGIPLINFLVNNPNKVALVLAPTRELAEQIYRVLGQMAMQLPLRGALIVGGVSSMEQVRKIRKGANVWVATPGRLIDLMQQRVVDLAKIEFLVLDEFDRMLDMGFAPQLEQIMPRIPKERQTMLFSATLPKEIMHLTNKFLRDPLNVAIGTSSAPAENIAQENVTVTHDNKADLLLKQLDQRSGKVLVFARTQVRTERVTKLLQRSGYQVECLHGGKSHQQRKRALEGFRSGLWRVLVATDLAGRGLDVNDIEHVINYDMPACREDYVHRIGRTGRYGKAGTAVNFLTAEDNWFLGRKNKSEVKKVARRPFKSKSKQFKPKRRNY